MIYIYRHEHAKSATKLATELGNAKHVQAIPRMTTGDRLVAWGEHVPGALNGDIVLRHKLTDAKILKREGVETITFSTTVKDGWLGRLGAHEDGNDLLNPPRYPEFWVKKEDIVKEIRVHSFEGVSIAAGIKVPRSAGGHHPWIRTGKGGWEIVYRSAEVKQSERDLAHAACKALGLTFGAVDIGRRADGTSFVLEVNRAPELGTVTVPAYAKAIKRHFGIS